MNAHTLARILLLLASLETSQEMEQRLFIRQEFDDSCGFASAASLLHCVWNIPVSESDLIDLVLSPGEHEVHTISLRTISWILSEYGIASQGYRMEVEDLQETLRRFGPMICWDSRDTGHFFLLMHVLHDGADHLFFTADPASGLEVLTAAQLRSRWSGKALVSASASHTISKKHEKILEERFTSWRTVHSRMAEIRSW